MVPSAPSRSTARPSATPSPTTCGSRSATPAIGWPPIPPCAWWCCAVPATTSAPAPTSPSCWPSGRRAAVVHGRQHGRRARAGHAAEAHRSPWCRATASAAAARSPSTATCASRVAGSRFGITPAKLGIVYPPASLERAVRLLGPAAKRLLYTGDLIDAPRGAAHRPRRRAAARR